MTFAGFWLLQALTLSYFQPLLKTLSFAWLNLIICPHDPVAWLQRAEVLLSLGFPEPAVGDAFKALPLIRQSRNAGDRLAAAVNHCLAINAQTSLANAEAQ